MNSKNQTQLSKAGSDNYVATILRSLLTGQFQLTLDERLQHMWSAVKMTIGNLIVRGYRLFKHIPSQQCIIFYKRQQHSTNYLFFKICESSQYKITPEMLKTLKVCMDQIEKFKKKSMQKYTVLFLFCLDYCVVQITACAELAKILLTPSSFFKYQLQSSIPKNNWIQECFAVGYSTNEQIIINESQQQHSKLKQILYSYIDTFGQKQKTNYHKPLLKKSLYLLNTLNVLIFEQTKPTCKHLESTPVYSQIQSASWTVFKTGKLKSDRKDIVFSGNGRILFVDLMFKYNINDYLNEEYEREVADLLRECQQAYVQAKVKVVKIENSLTSRNVYCYQSKIVDSFSKVPIS